MKRVGLVVAYDGTKYSGWQTQPNGITIQGVLNDTLSELLLPVSEYPVSVRKPSADRFTQP